MITYLFVLKLDFFCSICRLNTMRDSFEAQWYSVGITRFNKR
jgi:hypothetical protein